MNQTVHRVTKSDKFITFFIGEVDLNQKTLKYINAGHYPPVLYQSGKICRLTSGCTVIGAFERLPEINEDVVPLEEGALILSFTDGLADLRDEEGNYFQDDGIESFALKNGHLSANAFNEQLLKEIDQYRGEIDYPDDIAVITCKVKKFL